MEAITFDNGGVGMITNGGFGSITSDEDEEINNEPTGRIDPSWVPSRW